MLQQLMILNPAHEYRGMKIEPYETTQLGYAPDKYSHDRGGHVRVKHARRRLSAWRVVDPEGYARIFDTLEKAKAWIDSSGGRRSNPCGGRSMNPSGSESAARQYEQLYVRTRHAMGGMFDWPTLKIMIPGRAEELRRLWNLAYGESHPGFPPERSNPGHGFGMPGGPAHKFRLPRFHPGVIVRLATGRAELIQKYTGDSDGRGEWLVRWVDGPLAGGVVFKFLARNTPIDNPAPAWASPAEQDEAVALGLHRAGNPGVAYHRAGLGRAEAVRDLAMKRGDREDTQFWNGAAMAHGNSVKDIRFFRKLARDRREQRDPEPEGAPHDFEVTELVNFAATTGALFNQKKSITQNQMLKLAKGQFNLSLSARLWRYWYDAAAKLMEQETGWRPSTAVRQAAAEETARDEYAKMVGGEYGELPTFKTRGGLSRGHYQGKRPNPSGKGAAAGFRMFHDADPDKAYKVSVPDGFPRKLYMIGRLAKLVTTKGTVPGGEHPAADPDKAYKVSVPDGFPKKLYMLGRLAKLVTTQGTVRGGVLAAGAGNRMFVLGASKNLTGSSRAVQVEYIPPRNSRKAGALYYHKFTHAPLVQRHGSGGNYTIAGKGVKLTPRGITG